VNAIERTAEFNDWLTTVRDRKAQARILARIVSAEFGNFGDCKPVGKGVSEMRIHCGPGYRLYFTRRRERVYLLLAGGDKSSQAEDIKRAQGLLRDLE
jgi:putative addiction module killer protein